RPAPGLMRAEEDWSAFGRSGTGMQALDRLKYIELGQGRDAYLTLGGQARLAHEFFVNERFGDVPQDDTGSFILRLMPHANLRLGSHFRGFVELKSTHETGRDGGPGPVDVNRLDWHQGFAEMSIGDPRVSDATSLSFRLGRQEMYYGAGRLLDVRDGLAVRRTFDAILTRFNTRHLRIDGLFAVVVADRRGVFDDGRYAADTERARIWGAYAQTKALSLAGSGSRERTHGFDLYYIGVDQDDLVFVQGSGSEIRHSAGGRWWSGGAGFMHDVEATYQWGSFENEQSSETDRIVAWGAESVLRYTFQKVRFAPTMSVGGGAQSGDVDPTDGTLGSYRAPFPNLRWAGTTTGVGPGNGVGGTASAGMQASKTFRFDVTARVFFRLSNNDATYSPAGFPLRFTDNTVHYVGSGVGVATTWTPHPLVSAFLRTEIFEPGGFFAETDPSQAAWFVSIGSDFKF
ncbi:MAG: alginate export family protein, partial [Myxococcota bacterium]